MTLPPPRATRVAALARELAPLLADPGRAPALAEALDALVAGAFGLPEARPASALSEGAALRDLALDHALLFAPLLRPPLDPDALALAGALGPAVGWRRFHEPRPISPEEAAAWRRLEAAYEPVAAALDVRLRG